MEPQTRETRDERLARAIRAQIYSGEYRPGDALTAARELAKQHGFSAAMAQRALDILRREGLIRGEHGRGTYVCDRHLYAAEVTGTAAGRLPGTRQLDDAERTEPAVTGLTVTDSDGGRTWAMTVEAADAGPASVIALAVARLAGGTRSGWQLGVTVTPVDA